MTLHVYDFEQGSEAWHDARRGIVTASVVGQLITTKAPDALTVTCPACGSRKGEPCISASRRLPTPIKTFHSKRVITASDLPPVYEPAHNDTSRSVTALLVAERITGYTEPTFTTMDMFRGVQEEPIARGYYAEHYAPVAEVGFMVRELDGWRLGFSPDGLVGTDGCIEIKSRRAKKQLETILANEVPTENLAQIMAGLLVSGRDWCDYVSFSGGMPLFVKRVYPDRRWFEAIVEAVEEFEVRAAAMQARYDVAVDGLPMTERVDLEILI